MKSKKRFLAVLLLIVLAVSAMTGCGGGGGGASDTGGADDEKVLTFWNPATEEVDKAVIDAVVEKFNSTTKTGYKVVSMPVQNDTYKEKLVIAMSSGECPDMYVSWSGGPMNEYIESGFAQPITELFNASELPNRLMEGAIAQSTYNGDIYASPIASVALSGIYYNKEMFAEYGLSEPKTLGELEQICDTLIANGKTPFALANATKWTGSMYFMNLAARKGGLDPFAAAVDGSGTFEDECFIYAGNKIREWTEKGYFPQGVNSLSEDDGQARQLLYQETAAMDLIGSWYTGILKQDSEEFFAKLGWFPFPAIEGSDADPSITIGTIGENFVSFNCTGEKLAAAFECIALFSDSEIVDKMIESGRIPPLNGIADRITDPISKLIINAANNASSVQLWYDQYLPPAVAQAHLDTSQELFGLTMTSEESAKKFQDAMQTYIADNKE